MFTPCHFLRGNGHRPDLSHFLSPPKLALEGALYSTISPQRIARYVLPPISRFPTCIVTEGPHARLHLWLHWRLLPFELVLRVCVSSGGLCEHLIIRHRGTHFRVLHTKNSWKTHLHLCLVIALKSEEHWIRFGWYRYNLDLTGALRWVCSTFRKMSELNWWGWLHVAHLPFIRTVAQYLRLSDN